jgi:hypothetical protein
LTFGNVYVLVPFVSTQAAPATRFAAVIDALCTVVVFGLGAGLPGPLVIRLWERLTKISARFTALGKRPIKPRAIPNDPPLREPQLAEPQPDPRYKTLCLPKAEAWLLRLLPEAEPFAAQLQAMLAQPDMQALLQAKPSLIRLIRPLCRMLGVQPPAEPRPPRPEPDSAPIPQSANPQSANPQSANPQAANPQSANPQAANPQAAATHAPPPQPSWARPATVSPPPDPESKPA